MKNWRQEMKEIDTRIGTRISLQRKMLGITKKELGQMVGVSSQQIAKYEAATNRVSTSRLVIISRLLNKKMRFFYE
jgi:transcriptional regulator with XRE-family HTH domain